MWMFQGLTFVISLALSLVGRPRGASGHTDPRLTLEIIGPLSSVIFTRTYACTNTRPHMQTHTGKGFSGLVATGAMNVRSSPASNFFLPPTFTFPDKSGVHVCYPATFCSTLEVSFLIHT